MLKATATPQVQRQLPTYMVMLDLGIAPVQRRSGRFAEMVNKNKVKKFEITPARSSSYLGDVRPGDELTSSTCCGQGIRCEPRRPPARPTEYTPPASRGGEPGGVGRGG